MSLSTTAGAELAAVLGQLPASPYAPTPIHVRSATSQTDVSLTITHPHLTTALTLSALLRTSLPPPYASWRIRLIHAGRVLPENEALSKSLRIRIASAPPPRASQAPSLPPPPLSASARAKGKTPIRLHPPSPPPPPAAHPLYIHASFSDPPLEPEALEAEAAAARQSIESLLAATQSTSRHHHDPANSISKATGPSASSSSMTSASRACDANSLSSPLSPSTSLSSALPQGFDRLLSAGLSPVEVASLRSQFVAILANTHTPDTMPTGSELRALEERWLDNDHSGLGAGGVPQGDAAADGSGDRLGFVGAGGRGLSGAFGFGGGGGGATGTAAADFGNEEMGALEDMLWGNLAGFFWPIGAGFWLMREEGVWTKRRQVAVLTGFLVNVAFSVMRAVG